MNSRERMAAALRRQDVDYVPCCQAFSPSLIGPQHTWAGRTDTLDLVVGSLGLDATVPVSLDPSWHPDVTARVWREHRRGERWPVLHKELQTPLGPLSAAIWVTEDIEHPDDIPLVSDWNVSRYVKPWLATMEDVERFQYVCMPPSDTDIALARSAFAEATAIAVRYGLATQASCGRGLTAALSLFGAQQAVMLSMDRPDVLERMLEIEHEATMRQAEVLADFGVDIIVRNGFYETTDFWSPKQIEELLVPRLRREIGVMKSGGAAVVYTTETGVMPLLPVYADLGFDCYHAIEPVLGHQDMAAVAKALCPAHSVWGGVSGPIHIGEGNPEEARRAVRDAFATFGKRGLILRAVPSIRAHWPWQNALAMFDEWRALRDF